MNLKDLIKTIATIKEIVGYIDFADIFIRIFQLLAYAGLVVTIIGVFLFNFEWAIHLCQFGITLGLVSIVMVLILVAVDI